MNLPELLGAEAWSRLPLHVQRRFADHGAPIHYEGRMDLRCSRVGRVMAALAMCLGGPLKGVHATDVPTSVDVRPDGRGGVVWERRFRGDDAERTLRSTKQRGRDGRLVERTDGGLSMSLDVFEAKGALVFQSRRFWLAFGGWHLPLPSFLTPGVCRVTHTDLGAGRFRFELSMRHALWGETFHQCGVFADPEGLSS